MPITPYSSSDLTRSKNNRQIYSGYRINIQANQLGIPAIPTAIKGPSRDIVQALREGPLYFTPAELTAILNNNSGSTAAPGPPAPPPGPTPLIFSSTDTIPLAFPYTIPSGYTQLVYVIIGGGGGGGNDSFTSGLGGGSGGIRSETVPIVGGVTTISITLGAGGEAGIPSGSTFAPGGDGTSTSLTIGSNPPYNAGGGEGNQTTVVGANGGIPNGVGADNGSTSEGGALPAPYQAYGRGGNGAAVAGSAGNATSGGAGFYRITLT